LKKIKNFLKGVKTEMHKVRWPNKKEMAVYSFATIFCIVIFSLFFAGLDILRSLIKGVVH
jgi:preprotein translocase subunit SecE